MATKCIDLGNPLRRRSAKPIEFVEHLSTFKTIKPNSQKPSDFKYVELISKKYSADFDIMFAYQRPNFRQSGVLFLGHWNDGVVN